MAKFRKKPVVIEAVRAGELLHAAAKDWKALPTWIQEAYEKGEIMFLPGTIAITTLEGRMTCEADSWVIRGIKGEIYPCHPDIFEGTYEPVENQ